MGQLRGGVQVVGVNYQEIGVEAGAWMATEKRLGRVQKSAHMEASRRQNRKSG